MHIFIFQTYSLFAILIITLCTITWCLFLSDLEKNVSNASKGEDKNQKEITLLQKSVEKATTEAKQANEEMSSMKKTMQATIQNKEAMIRKQLEETKKANDEM